MLRPTTRWGWGVEGMAEGVIVRMAEETAEGIAEEVGEGMAEEAVEEVVEGMAEEVVEEVVEGMAEGVVEGGGSRAEGDNFIRQLPVLCVSAVTYSEELTAEDAKATQSSQRVPRILSSRPLRILCVFAVNQPEKTDHCNQPLVRFDEVARSIQPGEDGCSSPFGQRR